VVSWLEPYLDLFSPFDRADGAAIDLDLELAAS
jgi:hypothetical protein